MRASPRQLEVRELCCRFALADSAAEDVFRHALADDVRNSQLTPAFRAYYAMRSLVPLSVRQLMQRSRRVTVAADWYLPQSFIASLVDALQQGYREHHLIHPWPHGAQFAFVLTHDVESADGVQRITQIAEIEQELGFRSSWNFVPYKYPVDRGLLADLTQRGFEVGVHGYNHDGKLFTSRAEFNRRVPAINEALRSWGAVGFRAPMVHRNLDWMQSLDISYDASCFDVDPYQAMPGGVGSVWPFIAGHFVELPYTLPQDHTLFVARGERDGQVWLEKLRQIADWHGMSLVITHPDYLDSAERIDAYRQLLCQARETAGMWHALPREVATWWRQRDESELQPDPTGEWCISGPAAVEGRPATIWAEPNGRHGNSSPAATLIWSTQTASTPSRLGVFP